MPNKAHLFSGRPDRKGMDKVSYENHVNAIKNMKGTVDNSAPRKLNISYKKDMDKRRLYAAIEFDNKLLLERLARAVQHKSIDNEVHESVHRNLADIQKAVTQKKRADMQKITEENLRLLKRIQYVTPAYNHLEWEEDHKKSERFMKQMAMYPEYYERLEKERDPTKFTRTSSAQDTFPPNTLSSRGGGGGGLTEEENKRSGFVQSFRSQFNGSR